MSAAVPTPSPAASRLVADPDYLADIADVAAMGYGHPQTIRQRIRAGILPAVKVGGKYKVRVGDLPRPTAEPTAPRPDEDELEAIIATFSSLTAGQRVALGQLVNSRLNSRLQQASA